jgi:hypothetical protein
MTRPRTGERTAHPGDDVVRGDPGRLVDQQHAVHHLIIIK